MSVEAVKVSGVDGMPVQATVNPLVKGGRLVSAANERGDFRTAALVVGKAMKSNWLVKIPPLGFAESAPFDKGVNQAAVWLTPALADF